MKRIFFSWQSELPSRSNRTFIQTALEGAVSALGATETLMEAVIDRDTLDVPGAPNILTTIFDKIASADAFVADVSIMDIKAQRPCPNPNVLVELGYALRALGESRILLFMNSFFGPVEKLPFDLRQLRTFVYECDPETADKASIRKPFAATIQSGLRAIFSQLPTHRYPDVRVNATRGVLRPGVREEQTAVVSITIANQSAAAVHLSSIGLVLPPDPDGTPKGLWPERDAMGRANSGGRIEPGDRYDFFFDEKGFLDLLDEYPIVCVEATDRIGRHFRSNEVEFTKLVAELRGQHA
jgi:hypothetical protein